MKTPTLAATLIGVSVACCLTAGAAAAEKPHPLLTWVKCHPLEGAQGKPSPRMGYEASYGYDGLRRVLIRYGGHNQGGGGEQNSEVWTYDLEQDVWTLQQPNDAPPGVCCAQQNVFDDALRKFIRFPAFSGSHGWQSRREIYLKNSSVWTYDLDSNTWRAMRPAPEVWPHPLRGAAYDPHHQVVVLHGGEGARHGTVVYDLYANTWHAMNPPQPVPEAGISQPGFTYDAVHRVFVLFGSQFQTDPRTWAYDLRANRWRELQVKEHPPAEKSCPVMAADTRNGIVLCNVRTEDGLQTWALDVAKEDWTRLKLDREPDDSGSRNRILVYLPDENLFVLENRTKDEQQVWTFRYAETPPAKAPPTNLRVTTEPAGASLAWQAPPGDKGLRYNVYRGRGKRPWEVELRRVAEGVPKTAFQDTNLGPGEIYFYQVRGVDARGNEGPPSATARTQPPVPVDLCVSVLGAGRIELQWKKPTEQDIVGYHVERAGVGAYSTDEVQRIKSRYRHTSDLAVGRIRQIGAFRRLTKRPLAAVSFVDETVDLASAGERTAGQATSDTPLPADEVDSQGRPYRYAIYAYRVVAVNRLGTESGPSPLRFTYPSAVEHVFAKEEGEDQTRLKWQPNPQQGMAGYVVYRHDGRWDTDAIVRLTPEPIRATEFLDEKAGSDTRRYEIVAVDALGQEGEPSRPVWSRREWRRYYVPYVGQWHQ